jgi:hypothetical protein
LDIRLDRLQPSALDAFNPSFSNDSVAFREIQRSSIFRQAHSFPLLHKKHCDQKADQTDQHREDDD